MAAQPLISVYPAFAGVGSLLGSKHDEFPFNDPGFRFTHLGRGAVWLALEALRLEPGARIAMPAYHCGSEVEAARLAGLQIEFYRVKPDLTVDLEDLERAAAQCDATYLISNFGFPVPRSPIGSGGPVMVDAAHALFSCDGEGPIGAHGDVAVFCPRKTLGAPDGGGVLVRNGPLPEQPLGSPSRGAMARSTASLMLGKLSLSSFGPARSLARKAFGSASRGDEAALEGKMTEVVIGEWDLEVADMEAAATRPDRLTPRIARRADAELIRARRRENYSALAEHFAELAPEPFHQLADGVCPLYFPLLAPDRDRTIAELIVRGVRALEVWPVPHPLLDRTKFAELEPLRNGLIALPVNQLLEPRHIEQVVSATKAALQAR